MGYSGFSGLTNCPTNIAQHATCLVNGIIYAYGGYEGAGGYLQRLYSYNIGTGTWTELQNPLTPWNASAMPAMLSYNGDIYVFEGSTTPRVKKYVIATNTFSNFDDTGPNRFQHSVFEYNGKAYLIGGSTTDTTFTNVTVNIFQFSPPTWTTGTTYTNSDAQRRSPAAKYKNIIYMALSVASVGGSTVKLVAYNIDTDTWAQKASLTTVEGYTLNTPCMCSGNDGKIYLWGGELISGIVEGYSQYLYIYNIDTNTWTTSIQDTVNSKTDLSRMEFYNGNIYRIGGHDNVGGADHWTNVTRVTSGNTLPSITITSTSRSSET